MEIKQISNGRKRILFVLYSVFSVLFLEFFMHWFVMKTFNYNFIYPVLFAALTGLLLSLIVIFFPDTIRKIVFLVILFILTFYFEIQLVYHSIFGNFMPISQFKMGNDVLSNFKEQLFYGISKTIIPILVLFIPLVLFIVYCIVSKIKKFDKTGYKFKSIHTILHFLSIIFTVVLITVLFYTFSGVGSVAYVSLCDPSTSTDISYYNVGVIASSAGETGFMIFDTEDKGPIFRNTDIEKTDSETVYLNNKYNIIDNSSFECKSDDPKVEALNDYIATLKPTKKNEFTGKLENYNVISICAESFSSKIIDKELTPVLYEMSNSGFVFNNFFGSFQSVTTNGEYTMCTGLFPDMSKTKVDSTFDVSIGKYLPYTLGNALRNKGYKTFAYHNYFGDFYNRNVSHPNMGYDFKAVDSGLKVKVNWPSSDLEMFQASVDDYIYSKEPFHAYYMTFSGHYQYNWHNAMSAKNRDKVEHLNYSETVKAYIACNLELEYGLEYLINRLKTAGKLDNTVIVLTNDHYPYGLTDEEYDELCGEDASSSFEKYRNSFICYAPGLEKDYIIDSYCSSEDIIPTLLNLLNVDYDSRLLAGVDVLSDSLHMAILYDGSFITDDMEYSSATQSALRYNSDKIAKSDIEKYVNYAANKFILSKYLLSTDYYSYFYNYSGDNNQNIEVINFTDIKNVFKEASSVYVYRHGYMDAESSEIFGAENSMTLGELVDALYRIAGKPQYSLQKLDIKEYNKNYFKDTNYKDAVLWAFENKIILSQDEIYNYTDDVDDLTCSLVIYRFARLMKKDMSVDEENLKQLAENYPDFKDYELRTILWCHDKSVMKNNLVVEDVVNSCKNRPLYRVDVAEYLFYLDNYILK